MTTMIHTAGFVVMRVDFNSVGGEVGCDKSSGEDVLESLFPLKSRCNKRPGVSLEFSPQLSSSSSVSFFLYHTFALFFLFSLLTVFAV